MRGRVDFWTELGWTVQRKCKNITTRVTITRTTTVYFVFALLHFIAQLTLQSLSLAENVNGYRLTGALLHGANVPQGISVIQGNILEVCNGLPGASGTTCTPIARAGQQPRGLGYLNHLMEFQSLGSWAENSQTHSGSLFGRHHLNISTHSDGSLTVEQQVLGPQCVRSMVWPNAVLRESIEEDIVTLCFHAWLFVLSFLAIISESVPHLVAAFASYVLDLAWSAFRIRNTIRFDDRFTALITNGACRGVDVLADWWAPRLTHSIIICVLNGVVLIGMTYVTWVLSRRYTRESFERVAVNARITRMYQIMLVFSVCIHLGGFFGVTAAGVLVSKLKSIKQLVNNTTAAETSFLVVALLELPWVITGWVFPRIECAYTCVAFFVISSALIAIWSAMLHTPMVQFIFHEWSFFSTLSVTAFAFLVFAFIIGIWCRWNFDKGLGHYLRVRAILEKDDFTPDSYQKRDLEAKDPDLYSDSGSIYLERLGIQKQEKPLLLIETEQSKVTAPPPAYIGARIRTDSPSSMDSEATITGYAPATSPNSLSPARTVTPTSLSPPKRSPSATLLATISEPRAEDTPAIAVPTAQGDDVGVDAKPAPLPTPLAGQFHHEQRPNRPPNSFAKFSHEGGSSRGGSRTNSWISSVVSGASRNSQIQSIASSTTTQGTFGVRMPSRR
ncbi:hypothetical protein PUNSTDRAFT_115787 [Punctularia strigosozonata HHB-11173 SS5]|uniref:uncharacterized protein n=1 Tax=Punctularia strigosozonata (strain HHB-11173) TaxID=741275 RepID=UPI0004416339|nr:uncharacterized protein PUNSTDRAFT_115787 [Punctularia strigosozonata HHB-11173 SS5]EIN05892.1 hypothetical protein PUNSTDRAFT_115787 [Punctularia strigosozonata HHB-11173 SS5]